MFTRVEQDTKEMEIPELENDALEKETHPEDADVDLVGELIAIIETVKVVGEYRRTQKKECGNLVRRMKLFMPFLEEIKELDSPIPEPAIECLEQLKKAFQSAKKLLNTCHAGSKIYLALESEAMMVKFHSIYEKINQALDGMPFDELGISDEEKEQLELLQVQLKRARRRTDTQDMELAMDLMVVLTKDDRNADSPSVERLANKLALHTVEEIEEETLAVRGLVKERKGHNSENTQQIVDLLSRFKIFAGVPESSTLDDSEDVPKALEKTPTTLAIPNEFLCPITLEIMTDPVIVATGQSYEKKSIQQWLDSNHRTCPKTGQVLTHLSLAPNFALKNLIMQWCEKNNFELPNKEATPTAENPTGAGDAKILSLVQDLSSSTLNRQREAVKKIRVISKESPENRVLIAKSGAIPPLVQLLSYPDSKIQENAVTALLNLSIDETNKKLISQEGPIPAIIEILQKGSIGAKENSAAALFSLSMLDENKAIIGSLNGIPPLVELLKTGTIRGKKDAVTALFNLTLNHANKAKAIEAGIVKPILKVLQDKKLEMVNEALSLLLVLGSNHEGRQEIGQIQFIETLINLIKDGTPKNKECALALLLELGSNNSNLMLAALQYGVYEPLMDVVKNGTERGQRKAKSILRVMSKAEQIPQVEL